MDLAPGFAWMERSGIHDGRLSISLSLHPGYEN
jgi:hypothetical protein